MKISIIGTTTFPCPPVGYGGEICIYDLAIGLHKLNHEVILYGVENPDSEYPFKLNKLRNTFGEANWEVEFEAWKYYKDDIISSDVVLDMSHGKLIAQYLHNYQIKKEVACYLIGNYWAQPNSKFNMIVNSAKQLDMGIKGENGFEGNAMQNQHSYTGTIPLTSKYIHLGVNTDLYKFQENKTDYFLFMGRFHESKGPHITIELAKETGINLIMIGDMVSHPLHKSFGEHCLKLIEGYDNIKYISLPQDITHQALKIKLIQNAKCFLNPIQFHESFGLVNIEALSCGTPVISNSMGALPEIIKHGETGFLYKNYEELKNYIKIIDEIDPKNCRKDIEKRFSREIMSKNYEELLIQLKYGLKW